MIALKYKLVFVIATSVILFNRCSKKDDLPELEYNKWQEFIENPIVITSIDTVVANPTECKVKVHFYFDRPSFEAKWSNVSDVSFSIVHVGPTQRPTSGVNITLDGQGFGAATPVYAYTSSNYQIIYSLTFDNGRQTPVIDTVRFTTPSY